MSCQPACQWGQIVGNQTTTATRAWRCTAMPQRPWLCNNVRTIAAAKERFLLKIEREKHPTVVHKRLSIVTHTHTHECAHIRTHTAGWEHILAPLGERFLFESLFTVSAGWFIFQGSHNDSRRLKCSIRLRTEMQFTHTNTHTPTCTQWGANGPPTVTSLNYYPWEFHMTQSSVPPIHHWGPNWRASLSSQLFTQFVAVLVLFFFVSSTLIYDSFECIKWFMCAVTWSFVSWHQASPKSIREMIFYLYFQHLWTLCLTSKLTGEKRKEKSSSVSFLTRGPSSSSVINFLLFTWDILVYLSWQWWQENEKEKEKKHPGETAFWLKLKQQIDVWGRPQNEAKSETAKLNGQRLRTHVSLPDSAPLQPWYGAWASPPTCSGPIKADSCQITSLGVAELHACWGQSVFSCVSVCLVCEPTYEESKQIQKWKLTLIISSTNHQLIHKHVIQ